MLSGVQTKESVSIGKLNNQCQLGERRSGGKGDISGEDFGDPMVGQLCVMGLKVDRMSISRSDGLKNVSKTTVGTNIVGAASSAPLQVSHPTIVVAQEVTLNWKR